VPQFFLCMLTDTPYSKTPGTSMHLHISKECACHSQVLPLASTPHISRALPTPSWGLTTLQRSRIILTAANGGTRLSPRNNRPVLNGA